MIHVIGEIYTFFHGHTLLGETDMGDLVPVGRSEDNAVNYHQVSGWPGSCYECNGIPEASEQEKTTSL